MNWTPLKNLLAASLIWQGAFVPFIEDLTAVLQLSCAALGFVAGVITIREKIKRKP